MREREGGKEKERGGRGREGERESRVDIHLHFAEMMDSLVN